MFELKCEGSNNKKMQYDVIGIESMTELTRRQTSSRGLTLSGGIHPPDAIQTPQGEPDMDSGRRQGWGSIFKEIIPCEKVNQIVSLLPEQLDASAFSPCQALQ